MYSESCTREARFLYESADKTRIPVPACHALSHTLKAASADYPPLNFKSCLGRPELAGESEVTVCQVRAPIESAGQPYWEREKKAAM